MEILSEVVDDDEEEEELDTLLDELNVLLELADELELLALELEAELEELVLELELELETELESELDELATIGTSPPPPPPQAARGLNTNTSRLIVSTLFIGCSQYKNPGPDIGNEF